MASTPPVQRSSLVMREQGQGYEDRARSQNNAKLHVARGSRVGIRFKKKMKKNQGQSWNWGRAGERLTGQEARKATGMPFLFLRRSQRSLWDRIIMLWVY